MSQMVECYQVEMVALLNLGISCELTNNLHKAIEWHTLVNENSIDKISNNYINYNYTIFSPST